jgi:hypothetical protein
MGCVIDKDAPLEWRAPGNEAHAVQAFCRLSGIPGISGRDRGVRTCAGLPDVGAVAVRYSVIFG